MWFSGLWNQPMQWWGIGDFHIPHTTQMLLTKSDHSIVEGPGLQNFKTNNRSEWWWWWWSRLVGYFLWGEMIKFKVALNQILSAHNLWRTASIDYRVGTCRRRLNKFELFSLKSSLHTTSCCHHHSENFKFSHEGHQLS